MVLVQVVDYKKRSKFIELRINKNHGDYESIIENIKNLDYTFVGIGGVEIGEKEEYENIEHVHVVICNINQLTIQSVINRIKLTGDIGRYIGIFSKEDILRRITYMYKKETKLLNEERIMFQKMKPEFWDFMVNQNIKESKMAQTKKNALDLQMERLEIARNIIYDDILTSEKEEIIYHKGYFATSAGIKFYGSVRDKEIMKTIKDVGYKYSCLPDPDLENKGLIHYYQNIMIVGAGGKGKTRTMLYYLEHVKKILVYLITPRPYMDRYDPRVYDILFWDDIDATDIRAFGGMAKLKKMTDGKPFTYEEKYMKACISDYKPWWFTSNTEYLGDFKDKNDQNENPGLHQQLSRRMHILSLKEFEMNFGIRWDKKKEEYYMVKPEPLKHVNGRYIKVSEI